MYLDRAVLIPKVKGISFRTKGENTYVQYEIGRVYNPEKKYNNPRRVDIGIRIPGQEEMMLPNENYLQYFSDEMEKAEGVRENLLGDYEEERQRRYALRELFLPIFYEFQPEFPDHITMLPPVAPLPAMVRLPSPGKSVPASSRSHPESGLFPAP